jgi:hypothetical protein
LLIHQKIPTLRKGGEGWGTRKIVFESEFVFALEFVGAPYFRFVEGWGF